MFAASKTGKAVAAGVTTDPYFKNTVLLLNDTGTNGAQNNTFIDSSVNNFTITRNGNATQGSVNPYEPTGYWSSYFSTSGYLTIPTNTAFAYPADFTVEVFVFLPVQLTGATFTNNFLIGSDVNNGFVIQSNGAGTQWGVGSNNIAYDLLTSTQIPVNTWSHIAVVRSSSTMSIFLNGTRVATGTVTKSYPAPTTSWYVGYNPTYDLTYEKTISNLRIVKGTAVYDPTLTSLTVPTTPLTAISGTSFLALQNNRFKDNSSNNFTITTTGTPIVTSFNPFAPTASYSGATYGGSMYFDGNDDYLQTPTNSALAANSTSYTIEAWVYADMATYTVFDYGRGIASDYLTNSSGRWLLWLNNTGFLSFTEQNSAGGSDVTITDGVAFPLRQWVHVMGVKSGTTMYLFKNGASVNTATSASRTGFQGRLNVGQLTVDTGYRGYFLGYISNLRFLVGTALYTTSFTPPTAPVSAITNTQLLLNATNAGIYDATALNDMETVGNAQVSTAQYKWSPSSMAFNGTTDYLKYPPSNLFAFGTANFTIEGWVYLGSTNCGIFQIYSSYLPGTVSGLSFEIANLYGGWSLNYGATNQIISTTTGSTSTWYHFAVVRSSGVIKAYVNGTSIISATDTTNYTYTYLLVGGYYSTSYLLNGYLEDFRITKGVARYTANFTPPTAAFPTR